MRRVLIPFVLLLVTACAGLQPQTPRERLVAAETTVTAAYSSLLAAYNDGVVSAEDIVDLKPLIRTAEAALDAAHDAVVSGDAWTANDQITIALETANAINAEIRRRYNEQRNAP